MSCHPSHKKESREVARIHRWKHGHDPQDDDAVKGSPWEYVHISGENMSEDQTLINPYSRAHGPESGITCMRCGDDEMRVIDTKPVEEILKGLPGYVPHMAMRGLATMPDNVLMLICPKCELRVQIREDVVRRSRMKRREE